MALCATAVFATSLTHLTATPALYGSDYQLAFSNSNGGPGNPTSWVASLEHDRSITAIMLAATDEVSINGIRCRRPRREGGPWANAPVDRSTVGYPPGDDDMTLGVTTLHQVGAHVGSVRRSDRATAHRRFSHRSVSRRWHGVVPQRRRGRRARHRVGIHAGRLPESRVPART